MYEVVDRSVNILVDHAVWRSLYPTMYWPVYRAVGEAVFTHSAQIGFAWRDSTHPALQDFLRSCGPRTEGRV